VGKTCSAAAKLRYNTDQSHRPLERDAPRCNLFTATALY